MSGSRSECEWLWAEPCGILKLAMSMMQCYVQTAGLNVPNMRTSIDTINVQIRDAEAELATIQDCGTAQLNQLQQHLDRHREAVEVVLRETLSDIRASMPEALLERVDRTCHHSGFGGK